MDYINDYTFILGIFSIMTIKLSYRLNTEDY